MSLRKAFLPPIIGCLLLYIVLGMMKWDSEGAGLRILATMIGTFGMFVLFLPTTIAGLRNAPHYVGILVLNVVGPFFFGIGWLVALVWACISRQPDPVIVQHVYAQPPPIVTRQDVPNS